MERGSKRRIIAAWFLIGAGLAAGPGCAQDGTFRERLRERFAQRQQASSAPAAELSDPKAKLTKPGTYTYSIEYGGIQRAYMVHVPSGYDPARPAPLLVAMHGGGGDMNYQANDRYYGQISKSDKEGFVVAFPNGFSRLGGKLATWNAGNCCGQARDKNIDDVGFIRQMVGNLQQQLNIDRQKIYATGMSNGGMMAQRLACEMPQTFKAIAAVAATDNTKSCNPAQPISVLEIHARDDDHVPYNGGQGVKSLASQTTNFTSVPDSIARWVKRDGCSAAKPERTLDKPGAYCERYTGCQGGTKVAVCVTETGGHSWPGGVKPRGDGEPSKAISANDVMWEFFTSP